MKFSKKKLCSIIIFLLIFILCTLIIICNTNNKENKLNNDSVDKLDILDVKLETRIDTLNNYSYKDYFVVGWLQVQGTNIDMPIFTSILKGMEENNMEKIDFDYGWRQLNSKLGENRLVLSAHNIINVSSKPLKNMEVLSDFEALMAFVYHDFAEENQYIMYTDEDGNEDLYVIYGVGFTNDVDEEYNSIKFEDKEVLSQYIKSVKRDSIYDYGVDVNSEDEIISLITCTRFFGLDGNTLFRVDARKVRNNEETYKYNVNVNSNYNIIKEKLSKEDI